MHEIRQLEHDEFDMCADLLAGSEYYADVRPDQLAGTTIFGLFESEEGTLVGCGMVLINGAQAYVDYLYVHPFYQCEGWGTDLIDFLVKYMKNKKVVIMHACVSGTNSRLLPMIMKFKPSIGWPYTNVVINLKTEGTSDG